MDSGTSAAPVADSRLPTPNVEADFRGRWGREPGDRGRTKRISQFNGGRGDTVTPDRLGAVGGAGVPRLLVFGPGKSLGGASQLLESGCRLPRQIRPWRLKGQAGWRRVPELAFGFYFPLCPSPPPHTHP